MLLSETLVASSNSVLAKGAVFPTGGVRVVMLVQHEHPALREVLPWGRQIARDVREESCRAGTSVRSFTLQWPSSANQPEILAVPVQVEVAPERGIPRFRYRTFPSRGHLQGVPVGRAPERWEQALSLVSELWSSGPRPNRFVC